MFCIVCTQFSNLYLTGAIDWMMENHILKNMSASTFCLSFMITQPIQHFLKFDFPFHIEYYVSFSLTFFIWLIKFSFHFALTRFSGALRYNLVTTDY